MLEQLFPKYHRRYAASPHAKELRAFAHWLDEVGYGRDPAHDHVRRLREALDCWRQFKIDHLGVRTFSWTGLCRKSKARPILDRAQRAQ